LRDQGFIWVVDADISSFFDEVDHDLLMDAVRELVSDPMIRKLINRWLRADVKEGDRYFRLDKGVPQGSPISPMLANLYLDRLDEAILAEQLRIVRFADDFLILCRDRKQAEKALDFTAEVLETLRLELNRQKTEIKDFNRGFRFLGVEFVRTLILKAKHPEIKPEFIDTQTLALIPSQKEKSCPAAPLPETTMAMALSEAGLKPDDFPDQVEQVMETPPPDPEEPMKKVVDHDPRLRTLYILEHGYVLGKESERFTISRGSKVVQRVPAIKVDQIMIFGNAQITTQAMHFCILSKIPVFLLNGQGKYYGVIDGFDTDPVLLHRDQFARAADPTFCLGISRDFIRGKIKNSIGLLRRYIKNRNLTSLQPAVTELQKIDTRIENTTDLNQLRGLEGNGARIYFAAFGRVLDPDWGFNGREKQPPGDPVNSMLSYGYTLLFYNLYSFVRARGLNPHIGLLHAVRSGHPALVSDIIEEFRSIVVDAVVFNLVFNRRVTPADFTLPERPGQGCLLSDQARKLFIAEMEKKMNSPITHPHSGLKLDYRRCLEHQIASLAAVIQGREERYHPLVLR